MSTPTIIRVLKYLQFIKPNPTKGFMEMNFLQSVPIFHCIILHSLLLFSANPCAFELYFCLYVESFSRLFSLPSTGRKVGK